MRPGLRVLGDETGLPALPFNRVGMIERSESRSPEAQALAEEIRASLTGSQQAQAERSIAGIETAPAGHHLRARSRLAAA
jgi:hypothetical protein